MPKKIKKSVASLKKRSKTRNSAGGFFTPRRKLVVFVIVFSIIGSFVLYSVFAGNVRTANIEAESFSLPSNVKVISSSSADGGKAVQLKSNASIKKTVSLPSNVVQIALRAKGLQCRGAPKAVIKIDGVAINTHSVSATNTWTNYWTNYAIPAGNHVITIGFTNNYSVYSGKTLRCTRDLFVDKIAFFSQQQDPEPEPEPSGSLPTPSSTGYAHTGVTLQACEQFKDSNGNYTINGGTGGVTVDRCNFPGNVIVTGGGPIIIKRSRIIPAGSGSTSADADSGVGLDIRTITGTLLVEDTEIVSSNISNPNQTGRIMYRPIVSRSGNRRPITLNRVYAHGARTGGDFTNNHNVTISDSYLGPNYNPVLPGQTRSTCTFTHPDEDRQHGSGLRLAGNVVNLTMLNVAVIGGYCNNMSGLLATYEEQGDNHDILIDGGLWEFATGSVGYGIAAGWTKGAGGIPASGNRNYDFTIRNLQISTRFVPDGCEYGCGQNWNTASSAHIAPLDPPKVWQNVTKYNPGHPEHGQPIGP